MTKPCGAQGRLGRIIGHSFIHNGPLLYGISPAVKRYWALTATNNNVDPNLVTLPASITIADLPDVDLRGYIQQVKFRGCFFVNKKAPWDGLV